MSDFLLELRSEEIPRACRAARAELEKLFRRELDACVEAGDHRLVDPAPPCADRARPAAATEAVAKNQGSAGWRARSGSGSTVKWCHKGDLETREVKGRATCSR